MTILNDKLCILKISSYLDNTHDMINFWITNKTIFQILLPLIENKYKEFLEDQYRIIVNDMNFKAKLIEEFSICTPLVRNTMFEYVIMCYEHWYLFSYNNNLKKELFIPKSVVFNDFLCEKSIDINKIFHDPFTHCTLYHRPSKSISYFRTLTI